MAQAVAEGTERLERLVQEQLDAHAGMQASMLESLAATHLETQRREADLLQVLELVSDLCRNAIDVIEAERDEHHAFLASITEALRPVIDAAATAKAIGPAGQAVHGGTVFAAPIDIDLVALEDGTPVEGQLPFR